MVGETSASRGDAPSLPARRKGVSTYRVHKTKVKILETSVRRKVGHRPCYSQNRHIR